MVAALVAAGDVCILFSMTIYDHNFGTDPDAPIEREIPRKQGDSAIRTVFLGRFESGMDKQPGMG